MHSDVKAQYQSSWNEWLTNISFWLTGALTVLNMIDELVLRTRSFLYLSDGNPLKKRWPEDASEVETMYLMKENLYRQDNVPLFNLGLHPNSRLQFLSASFYVPEPPCRGVVNYHSGGIHNPSTSARQPLRTRCFSQVGWFHCSHSTWWIHHRTVPRVDISLWSAGSCPWGS